MHQFLGLTPQEINNSNLIALRDHVGRETFFDPDTGRTYCQASRRDTRITKPGSRKSLMQ